MTSPTPTSIAAASLPRLPRIVSAANDMLADDTDHHCIDLFSGNGAAFLGHANPKIAAAIKTQLDKVWIVGGLEAPVLQQARDAISRFFPDHAVAGICSTGMEAAEFAMRIARANTGRTHFVGFEHAMHGKSAATAALGWQSHDGLEVPFIHKLPFLRTHTEAEVLAQLVTVLERRTIAAVFVEPLQGTGGGHLASTDFYNTLIHLCRRHQTLAIFDEILTGFFRTGEPFCFSSLAQAPDIVLVGKALANGFPASAVLTARAIAITPVMLPGSTFANNPLAASAIVATLEQMRTLNLPDAVARIEQAVQAALGDLPQPDQVTLRGKGALWILEFQDPALAQKLAVALYHRGVFASFTGRLLRILPAATIEPANLQTACQTLRATLLEILNG